MIVGRAALVLAAFAASCSDHPGAAARCPRGAAPDDARAAHVVALLDADADATARVARMGPRLCFGDAPGLGALIEDGARGDPVPAGGVRGGAHDPPVVLLAAGASDAELAARLAHLVRHVEEPPLVGGYAGGPIACTSAVVGAARVEAAAALDEHALRRRLGLGSLPRGEDVIRGYLARCRGGG